MTPSLGVGRIGKLTSTLPKGVGIPAWKSARRAAPAYAVPTGGSIYLSGTSPTSLPAGNDTTGDGTAAAPYATLTKALSVLATGGNRLVLCDGTFTENSSGRLILNKSFTAPVVFDSYDGNSSHFIITNASGTSGVVSCRSGAANNIQFRHATIRSSTDANALFLHNPATSGDKGSNIAFFDCTFETRTQAAVATCAIGLDSDNGITGLYFVRCNFKRVAGGSTTNDPLIIRTTSLTASSTNQPHSDIGFWDCTTEGAFHGFTTAGAGLMGVAKVTAVRCAFTVTKTYGLCIGTDTETATTPRCTNVYVQGCTLVAASSTAHALLLGFGCYATKDHDGTDGVLAEENTITSDMQGIVQKGSAYTFADRNTVNVTAAAGTPSAAYAKGAVNGGFRNNTINLNGASFACYGWREDVESVTSTKSGSNVFSGNTINATGANATALLWAAAAGSTGGAVANDNRITLASSAVLGSVRGTSVANLAALQAAWAADGLSGDAADNDSRSLVA